MMAEAVVKESAAEGMGEADVLRAQGQVEAEVALAKGQADA